MNKGERARRLAACPWAAPAGPALARLAVSRQLLTAVSRSVGFAVTRTNKAVYLADPPVALVHTQPSTKATIAVRVVLTYDLPPGSTGSDCSSTGPAPRSPDASGCSLARQSSCGREPRCTVAARRRRATDWPASASLQPPTEQRSPGGPAEPPRTGSAPDNLSDRKCSLLGRAMRIGSPPVSTCVIGKRSPVEQDNRDSEVRCSDFRNREVLRGAITVVAGAVQRR